jgi:iron complex transport system substrate-binding protein
MLSKLITIHPQSHLPPICWRTSTSLFAILIREMKKPLGRSHFRIVSLAPSATSILCSIGAMDFLVGVTKWCSEVAPVSALPQLGDCWHMDSVKDILKLKPSLVIGSVPYKIETVTKLLEHPINFLAMNPRTLADIADDIRMLGGIVNRPHQADRLVQSMRREFAAFTARSRTATKIRRVYCEAWPKPRISSPPWVAELVKICGATMVLPPGEKVTDEQVARAKPDVIILAWAATGDHAKVEAAYRVPAWSDLPAIRKKLVFVISDELLNTPGPPLIAGAKQLFRIFQEACLRENTKCSSS